MHFPAHLRSIVLLGCVTALWVTATYSQSLSIIRKGETNYTVEASASEGHPQTLQESANLHLWVDLHNGVQEPYSYALTQAGMARRYFRLVPSAADPEPIRVLLIGDSMAADCCGWGRGIYPYFKPTATVINYAMPWTSTKVFLQSAEYDKMLLIKPDYVLIQYGFIDGGTDLDRYTTLPEFADNLRSIVQTVRGFNGVPILITLHAARLWDDQGRLIPAWEDRNAVTRQVARELNTPLVDLYQSTRVLFSELGEKGTAFMHWEGADASDFMHFSQLGGQWVSRLLVNDLPDVLGPYLNGIFDPPPNPQ